MSIELIYRLYFDPGIPLDRLPEAVRAADPNIPQADLERNIRDTVREVQTRIFEQVYLDPERSSGNRGKLLEAVQEVDPKITGENLDDWLYDYRTDNLRRVYYDGNRGFGSIEKTWRLARRDDPWVSREEVADFIRKQSISQEMQRARRLGTFLATGAHEQVEIDIADFSTKAKKGDRVSMYGYEEGSSVPRYALVGIDVFSKKMAVVPMIDKDQKTVTPALASVVEQLGVPLRLVCDEGPEFDNRSILQFCRELGIALVFLRSYTNTVDRAIQTLKTMLFPRVQQLGMPWHRFLNPRGIDVVAEYNRTVHSTTGATPNAAHEERNNQKVFDHVKTSRRFLKKIRQGRRPPLEVDDVVKIQVPHSTTRRLNTAQYGPRPYRVEAVVSDGSGLRRFRVAGRLFLRHELLKVKDVQRNAGDRVVSIPGGGEDGDLPGAGALKASLPEAPAVPMTDIVMSETVPTTPRRRIRGNQFVMQTAPTVPNGFLEANKAMLESRRTGVDVEARERTFYRMVAQMAGQTVVIYTRERKVEMLRTTLTRLGYGMVDDDEETDDMRAMVNELNALDPPVRRRIRGKQPRVRPAPLPEAPATVAASPPSPLAPPTPPPAQLPPTPPVKAPPPAPPPAPSAKAPGLLGIFGAGPAPVVFPTGQAFRDVEFQPAKAPPAKAPAKAPPAKAPEPLPTVRSRNLVERWKELNRNRDTIDPRARDFDERTFYSAVAVEAGFDTRGRRFSPPETNAAKIELLQAALVMLQRRGEATIPPDVMSRSPALFGDTDLAAVIMRSCGFYLPNASPVSYRKSRDHPRYHQ